MLGMATLTMVRSSSVMNRPRASTARASQGADGRRFSVMVHPPPGSVRLTKELAQDLRRPFRPAASVAISRGPMTESGKLNPRDMRQDLPQCVQAGLQVCGALAAREQQHLGADSFEPLESPVHLGRQLNVVMQRRSELPHPQVLLVV